MATSISTNSAVVSSSIPLTSRTSLSPSTSVNVVTTASTSSSPPTTSSTTLITTSNSGISIMSSTTGISTTSTSSFVSLSATSSQVASTTSMPPPTFTSSFTSSSIFTSSNPPSSTSSTTTRPPPSSTFTSLPTTTSSIPPPVSTSSNVIPPVPTSSSNIISPSPPPVPTSSSNIISPSPPPPPIPTSSTNIIPPTVIPPVPSPTNTNPIPPVISPSISPSSNPVPSPSNPPIENPQLPGAIFSSVLPPMTTVSPGIVVTSLPSPGPIVDNPNNAEIVDFITNIRTPGSIVRTMDPFPAMPSQSLLPGGQSYRNPNPLFPNSDNAMTDQNGGNGVNVWVIVGGLLGALVVAGLIMGFLVSRRIYGSSSASRLRSHSNSSLVSSHSDHRSGGGSGSPESSFDLPRKYANLSSKSLSEQPVLPPLEPIHPLSSVVVQADGIGSDFASRIQPKPPVVRMPFLPAIPSAIEEEDENATNNDVSLARTIAKESSISTPVSTINTSSGQNTIDSRMTILSMDGGVSVRSSAVLSDFTGDIPASGMNISNLGAMIGSATGRNSIISTTASISGTNSRSSRAQSMMVLPSFNAGTVTTTSSYGGSDDDGSPKLRHHSVSPDKFSPLLRKSASPPRSTHSSQSSSPLSSLLTPPPPAVQKSSSSSHLPMISMSNNSTLVDLENAATSNVYRIANTLQY